MHEAHELLRRQEETHNRLKEELAQCQEQLSDQLIQCEKVKSQLDETCKQRNVDREANQLTHQHWQQQVLVSRLCLFRPSASASVLTMLNWQTIRGLRNRLDNVHKRSTLAAIKDAVAYHCICITWCLNCSLETCHVITHF